MNIFVYSRPFVFHRIVFAVAMSLFLSACNFEISSEINIDEGGAGELVTNISLSKKEYFNLPSGQKSSFCAGFNKQDKLGKVQLISRGEKVICRFKRAFSHIKKLREDGFKVATLDDGTLDLSINLTSVANTMGLRPDEDLTSQAQSRNQSFSWDQHLKDMGSILRDGMIADKSLRIKINAPHIVETNGIITEDQKSSEYGVPMLEILRRSDNQPKYSVDGRSPFASSSSGSLFAIGKSNGAIEIHDLKSKKFLKELQYSKKPMYGGLSFSPDEKYIASGREDGSIIVWQWESGKIIQTFKGEAKDFYTIAYSPDGKNIASGGSDGKITVWKVSTGQIIKTIDFSSDGATTHLHYSNDGKRIFSSHIIYLTNQSFKRIWDVESGTPVKVPGLSQTTLDYTGLFSPNGKKVIIPHSDGKFDIIDVSSGKKLKSLSVNDSMVLWASFLLDGKRIFTGSKSKTYILWDVLSGDKIKTFNDLGYNYDGSWENSNYLIFKSIKSSPLEPEGFHLYSAESGNKILTYKGKGQVGAILNGKYKYYWDSYFVQKEPPLSRMTFYELPKPIIFRAKFFCKKNFLGMKKC